MTMLSGLFLVAWAEILSARNTCLGEGLGEFDHPPGHYLNAIKPLNFHSHLPKQVPLIAFQPPLDFLSLVFQHGNPALKKERNVCVPQFLFSIFCGLHWSSRDPDLNFTVYSFSYPLSTQISKYKSGKFQS